MPNSRRNQQRVPHSLPIAHAQGLPSGVRVHLPEYHTSVAPLYPPLTPPVAPPGPVQPQWAENAPQNLPQIQHCLTCGFVNAEVYLFPYHPFPPPLHQHIKDPPPPVAAPIPLQFILFHFTIAVFRFTITIRGSTAIHRHSSSCLLAAAGVMM